MTIWYGPEWKSVKAGGKACDWKWKTLSTVITYDPGDTNQRVRVTYQKDSGGSGGSDTAYIRNFRINGIEIFALAPLNPDMAGSYTATDGTVVKVSAGGGVTIGEETVPYTVVNDNVIGVTLAAGYREITLNKADNSCVVAVPQVSVTYNYGGHGENTVINVDKNSAQTVLAETPVTGGFIFRGWYKDAALTEKVEAGSSFTANADITFYAKWDKAITVTFKYEDNGAHADETDTTLYAND
ncbi:MAG: InlB B-repeat-containing protein, partial [Clostridia bacterium]|nr:InlB B-repeat-containing protein [Clostridia bacterium]